MDQSTMLYRLVFLIFAVSTTVCARFAQPVQNSIDDDDNEIVKPRSSGSLMGDLYYGFKLYKECVVTDLSTCLKMKLVEIMDRADRAYPEVDLIDGVSFVKENKAVSYDPIMSTEKLEEILPRSLDGKDQALNALISDKISNFFNTHKLQLKLPTMTDLQRSFDDGEARKKKKPLSYTTIIPLTVATFLIPAAIVAIAIFAGKALLASVIAITLSGIIGLRYLFAYGSHHHHDHDHGHVPSHHTRHGPPHGLEQGPKIVVQADSPDEYSGRYSERDETAHDIAYNAYSQKHR